MLYTSQLPLDISIMTLARSWALARSKDPHTKVGAVVYDPVTGGMFFGYNGFPSGVLDKKEIWDNRDQNDPFSKYAFVIHAEVNAVRKAMMALGDQTSRCVLYVTHYPCHRCMKDMIIPAGIKDVRYGSAYPPDPVTALLASQCNVTLRPCVLDLSSTET